MKTVLITAAGRRIGAVMAQYLHSLGYAVCIHCQHSIAEAETLAAQLNEKRSDSAYVYSFDLKQIDKMPMLVEKVIEHWGRLDVVINNASIFYPTELASVAIEDWQNMMDVNAKAPFFLAQAAYPYLKSTQGQIINITDIHAENPLKNYGLYTMSKALLLHQTQCLAQEWAPEVRVNAIAPGMVLWPEGKNALDNVKKREILNQTPLKRPVDPLSIAKTAAFFIQNEDITGEVVHVSGGRS